MPRPQHPGWPNAGVIDREAEPPAITPGAKYFTGVGIRAPLRHGLDWSYTRMSVRMPYMLRGTGAYSQPGRVNDKGAVERGGGINKPSFGPRVPIYQAPARSSSQTRRELSVDGDPANRNRIWPINAAGYFAARTLA